MNSSNSSVTLDRDLFISTRGETLIFEWKCVCTFKKTQVYRHICEAIDRATALRWIQVMADRNCCNALSDGLCLIRNGRTVELRFTRVFFSPESLTLSEPAQETLQNALARFVGGG
jgi:hypothetical protein